MSDPRRSRRIQGENPEYEDIDPAQRVTPPRDGSHRGATPRTGEGRARVQPGGAISFRAGAPSESSSSSSEGGRTSAGANVSGYRSSWSTLPSSLSWEQFHDPDFSPGGYAEDLFDSSLQFHAYPPSDPGETRRVDCPVLRRTVSAGSLGRDTGGGNNLETMAHGGAAGGGADEELRKIQDRARRSMAGTRRRFDQRRQDLHNQWRDAREARLEHEDVLGTPREAECVRRVRIAVIQAKERRQEILTDRRTWLEHLYEAGYTEDEESQHVREFDHLYNESVEEHERELEVGTRFLKKVDDQEKLVTDPVDTRLFKLPPLSIQEFDGDREKFVSFQQNFEALVGKQKLRDHQKLTHLRGCLKGKAADAIVSVGTEDADYQRAWDILTRRFGDRAELVREILASMSRMELPFKSNPEVQRQYCDEITSKYNRLIEVDPHSRDSDSTILPLIMNCFSAPIKSDLIKELGKFPTVTRFLERAQELIGIEVHVRGKTHFSGQNPQGQKKAGPNPRRPGNNGGGRGFGMPPGGTVASLAAITTRGQLKRGAGNARGGAGNKFGPPRATNMNHFNNANNGNNGANGNGAGGGGYKCTVCGVAGHGLATCPEFKKLTLKGRLDKVRSSKCCFRCLRAGHFSKECNSAKKCTALVNGKECGKNSHHHLLHRQPNQNQ